MDDFPRITRQIQELEQALQEYGGVRCLTYQGIPAWPLIKIRIRKHLLHPHFNVLNRELARKGDTPETGLASYLLRTFTLDPDSNPSQAQAEHLKEMTRLEGLEQRDLFFLSRPRQHAPLLGTHLVPQIDGLIHLLEPEFSAHKGELVLQQEHLNQQRLVPTLFLQVRPFLTAAYHDALQQEDHKIDGFSQLMDAMQRVGGDVFFTERSMANILSEHLLFTEYFKQVLTALKPKAVFQVCFHYATGMALNAAAHAMKIPCIDIQHGTIDNEPAYLGWQGAPPSGWPQLPSFFWAWGKAFAEPIAKGLDAPGPHRVVTGGNPWIVWWRDSAPELDITDMPDMGSTLLFTLDPIENPIPEHVVRAMQELGADWNWLLRPHPLWRDRIPELECVLAQAGVANAHMDGPAMAPLPALFERVDAHITCSSSSCYEALAHGLRTAIVHERGFHQHRRFIDQGVFWHAPDTDSLVRFLRHPAPFPSEAAMVIQDFDKDKAVDLVKLLISERPR
ncbi:MAG: hypothetical protein D6E12_18530 [Desulfovibrio sp.]|nr:MAG: hypothetical protein D6E12_18530 [Desulfovibrio sp.]